MLVYSRTKHMINETMFHKNEFKGILFKQIAGLKYT
jgi:hypothetical protein